MTKQIIIAAALCLLCLQLKAQPLFMAKDSIVSMYLKELNYDTTAMQWILLDTLAAVTSMGDIVYHEYVERWDTIVGCDTIKPDYIIGMSKAGDLFIFGAKHIIHRYKRRIRTNAYTLYSERGKWWDESYQICGAPTVSLNKLDIMVAYGEDVNGLTWLGVKCTPVKGVKLGNKKIKVVNR